MTDQTPDLADALDEFARYLATAARLAGARIAAALIPDPADEPRRRADADATAALRDDLTHALGSDHLADLALRAVEPALLAVEVDTAQRMQDDVDHWRARADKAGNHAALLREQVRDLKAERDAFRFRAEAAEKAARLDEQRADRAERERNLARDALVAANGRADRAARRADEQQQRAQRAEADAADWRTVAQDVEAALQRVRDLVDRWDHTIDAGPQASALRDALTGAQAAEPPSD